MNQTFLTGSYWQIYWSRFPPLTQLGGNVIGTVMLIMAILSVLGNASVIYILGRSPKSRKINLFRINLAISELFSPLLTYWMVITSAYKQDWGYGRAGCHYYAFSTGWLALTSISNLSAVAIERCLVISKPFIKQRLTMKVKLAVVLVTWLYAFALAVPPLLGWGDYITDGYKISCCFDYLSRNPENRSFIFYLFTGGFGVPLAIILVSYTKIFIVIRANEKQMKMQKHNGKSPKDRNFSIDSTLNSTIANEDTSSVFNRNFHTGSTPMIIYKSSSQSTPLIQLKSRWFHRANSDVGQKPTSQGTEVRLAKVILIVIVVFIGSWAPYAILALIGQFGPPDLITPEVSTATAVLAKISVVYNPFIYGWKDFGFRQKLRRILRGSKDRKQSTVDNRLLASTFSL